MEQMELTDFHRRVASEVLVHLGGHDAESELQSRGQHLDEKGGADDQPTPAALWKHRPIK